jgi:hypothetical protein
MDVFAKHPPFGQYHFLSELVSSVGNAIGGIGGSKSSGSSSSVQTRDVGLTGPQFTKVLKNTFASVNKSSALAIRSSNQALKAVSQQSLILPLAIIVVVGIIFFKGKSA